MHVLQMWIWCALMDSFPRSQMTTATLSTMMASQAWLCASATAATKRISMRYSLAKSLYIQLCSSSQSSWHHMCSAQGCQTMIVPKLGRVSHYLPSVVGTVA